MKIPSMRGIGGGKIAVACLMAGVLLVAFLATNSRALAFDPEMMKRGVVRVVVEEGHGTGFVVNQNGHVVTNHHVIGGVLRGGGQLGVMPTGSSTLYPAEIIYASQSLDLAVLRVPGLGLSPLTLSTTERKVAQVVWSAGFPGAADALNPQNNATIQKDIISTLHMGSWGGGDQFPIIQHGASISSGNSGGPLLDDCGRVIGVNTWASLLTVEDAQGEIRRVPLGSGIFWSSDIVETVRMLNQLSLPFQTEDSECIAADGEAEELREEMQEQQERLEESLGELQEQSEKERLRTALILFAGGLALALVLVLSLKNLRRRILALMKDISQSMQVQAGQERSWFGTRRKTSQGGVVVSGFDGSGNRIRIVLSSDRFADQRVGISFGRDPALVDEVVKDPSISSRHMSISSVRGGEFFVEDLNSRNGTIVDGRKLRPFRAERCGYNSTLTAGNVELILSKR